MMRNIILYIIGIILFGSSLNCLANTHPNIVLIYADDLGYGDVSCYNDQSKISTPHIDKLAEAGILFTDAHSPSGVCSPSRYGILTGRYSWRTERKSGNPPPGAQPWLDEGRRTLASMLKDYGYNTAVFGKWGLGSDWQAAAKPGRRGLDISANAIDYSKPVHSGKPFGFTHEEVHLWYGDSPQYRKHYPCYDEEGAIGSYDGGRWYFENGMSIGGDPKFDEFDMEEAQMHYIQRSVDYIHAAAKNSESTAFNLKKDAPFFLYYAPHIPHWPLVPAKQFQGTSGVGLYGDFIVELDWAVGEIVNALEQNNLLDETIIIFTSDNGPESQVFGYMDKYDHYSIKDFRGVKRDVWQGGHTVPFIVSYPAKVNSGQITNRLVSQTDIMSTIADYLNIELDNNTAEDSYSFLDELISEHSVGNKRETVVHHSASGKLAFRQGDWVYIDSNSGRDNVEPQWFREMIGVEPHNEEYELFNLKEDFQQTKNLLKVYPDKAAELRSLLNKEVNKLSSISPDYKVIKADTYILKQNYPNPFNPSTTLSYYLSEKADVKLDIYNVLGKKIASLVKGPKSAGLNTVLWNGQNDYGETAHSGVYYTRITANIRGKVYTDIKKVVLLK